MPAGPVLVVVAYYVRANVGELLEVVAVGLMDDLAALVAYGSRRIIYRKGIVAFPTCPETVEALKPAVMNCADPLV